MNKTNDTNKNIKIKKYDDFKCTADQCQMTCCQEWRIGVDENTFNKWQGHSLKEGLNVCSCVKEEGGIKNLALNPEKRCHFLNDQKLCKLVIELGEDYLSETCTTFPRQINKVKDRTEYSLAACCPVVVDLLKESNQVVDLTSLVENQHKDSLLDHVREMMIRIMEEEAYSLTERIMIVFYALLESMEDRKLTPAKVAAYQHKNHMKPLVQAIRQMPFNRMDTFWESNELFLDIVENYRKQELYVGYLEEIAKQAEKLEEAHEEKTLKEKVKRFDKAFEVYEKLLKNYIVSEIFGSSVMEEGNLEDVVVAFEWIALEYATIKQAIFLKWHQTGEGSVDYNLVRDYIVVIARVTGYDQEDMKEFLQKSFKSMIWDWGYLALIVGNGNI